MCFYPVNLLPGGPLRKIIGSNAFDLIQTRQVQEDKCKNE